MYANKDSVKADEIYDDKILKIEELEELFTQL